MHSCIIFLLCFLRIANPIPNIVIFQFSQPFFSLLCLIKRFIFSRFFSSYPLLLVLSSQKCGESCLFSPQNLRRKQLQSELLPLQKNSASEHSNSLALLVDSLKPYFRFFSLRLNLTIRSVS